MFDDIFDAVGSADRANKYLDSLSKDERALVDDFVTWLQLRVGIKPDSARSYKSNLARAVYKTRNEGSGEVNSDERTAVKRFREYCDELAEILVDAES